MNFKKILVTGSNGLLGQKLLDNLRNRHDIILMASSIGADRYPYPGFYTYATLDITDKAAVHSLINNFKPDAIIHTAAMTNVDACESQQEACWDLNVNALDHIIAAAQAIGSHIIHLSTDFVFDGEAGPYKEDDKPAPLSYYGQSKATSEEHLSNYTHDWTIIRTIIVYGIVKDMSRTNIVLWAKKALGENKEITVVDDQFRSPTLAEDLAQACVAAVFKGKTGIYHVSGKDFMSIIELVERVADHYGLNKKLIKPIKSASLNQAAKRPPRTGFILDKAYKELDYKPHSFEEGIEILDVQLKELGLLN